MAVNISTIIEVTKNKAKDTSKRCLKQSQTRLKSKDFWIKKFPIIGWLTGYSISFFISDLIAGLTVGLVVIPLSIGSSIVAGMPPQYGLYSAIVPGFIYLFFGTSKDISIGPSVTCGILVKPFVDKFGPDIAILITLLSGIIISTLGIFQLGFLINFISMPVLTGYISAAAISIIFSQLAPLLGIKNNGSTFLEYFKNFVNRVQDTKLWDPVAGVICILFILFLKFIQKYSKDTSKSKWKKFRNGVIKYLGFGRSALVIIIATGIIMGLIALTGEPHIAITGTVKEGLPDILVPNFIINHNNHTLTVHEASTELSSAIIIPFILILDNIVIAKSRAKDGRVDATQEMFTLGLINIVGSFFQAMPVTGSFSRTAVNKAAGVKTPIGGIFSGTLVILCLLFLSTYIQYIPKPTLSAVIICAVISMIKIIQVTKEIWKSTKKDLIAVYTTFLGCLFIGMDYGFVIGVGINLLFILYEAARIKVECKTIKIDEDNSILLVQPDRAVMYPSTENFKQIITTNEKESNIIVIDGRSVYTIDSTTVKSLKILFNRLKDNNKKIIFWNWNINIISQLNQLDLNGNEIFYQTDTLDHLLHLLKSNKLNKEDV